MPEFPVTRTTLETVTVEANDRDDALEVAAGLDDAEWERQETLTLEVADLPKPPSDDELPEGSLGQYYT